MPSSFTSRLKLERQASGENSGNWGNLVNYVLNRVDASVSGYQAVNVAGSANVTLTSNNSTSNTDDSTTDDQVHNATLEFTGALTCNINVFTDAVEQNYVVFNNTTGSFSLTFGNTGHAANGVVLKQGAKSIVYTDGSTMFDVMADLGDVTAKNLTLDSAGELKIQDTTGGQSVGLKANGTTTTYTLTLPPATGSADQIIKTDGSGNLSFVDQDTGIDWDTTPKTTTVTGEAGRGYFVNTTSGQVIVNLPAGVAGETIAVVDYAATWQNNNCLIVPNGTDKIGGLSANLTLSTEGQNVQWVFVDSTQGWVPVNDGTSNPRAENFITATVSGSCNTLTCAPDGGGYKLAIFRNPGTFCVSAVSDKAVNNVLDYLVVAGGGGGATDNGGGGGGGGVRFSSSTYTFCGPASPREGGANVTATVQGYPIVAGGGGAGGSVPTGKGSDSSGLGKTGTGGGAGTPDGTPSGSESDGGSGGGSGQGISPVGSGNTPPFSPSQGSDSGGSNSNPGGGGGGGGYMGTGGGSSGNNGGAGGTSGGFPDMIAGALGESSGGFQQVSGGGGGGVGQPGSGSGGTAGGGGSTPGGPNSNPSPANATALTGGGGGGGGQAGAGANGGSGFVIIRYKAS